MPIQPSHLSRTFSDFFESEKASGVLLIFCTLISLGIANSSFGSVYQQIWQAKVAGLSIEHWINDGCMAVFFLFIGLELERELYVGELSDFKNALLPIFAAIGGIALPALIHFVLNASTPTRAGAGIPMATDIAFALGTLALLGKRVPASLKVFLTALAVMDDLGAIIVIAVFYTVQVSLFYLLVAFVVFVSLVILNRTFRVMSLLPYLLGGVLLWFLMLKSGVHSTIAGVMLAFAIPFSAKVENENSPSHYLEHFLHKPVAFAILPAFALANTAVVISAGWWDDLRTTNSLGIIGGLLIGKPVGITLLCLLAVTVGICRLPRDLGWRHVFGAGLLGGIGFTMSIFITNLAFANNPVFINASKITVLLTSICAGGLGFLWLRVVTNEPGKEDPIVKTESSRV
ncbi:Na+/H+ antiporter NhaA [Propionivibrio sp.]|uniref:Na+/H+ antiporter NhaA n=1 Tax=Propionivibrio sp. TaxID=2212460 RepID=UPI00262CF7B0|nr:Na+/H+ antiporter NhaA [Propionivibrio sp.]